MQPLARLGIHLEPSTFLAPEGLEVVHEPSRWRAKGGMVLEGVRRRLRDLLAARSYDLVLVHRESLPLGPAWIERVLNHTGIPYAFDFDDAVYLPAATASNRRLAWVKLTGKVKRIVSGASLVFAGNEHLADWAQQYTTRVTVIPTTIDTDSYRVVERRHGGPVCVGWSGSRTSIVTMKLLEPVLCELQRTRGIRIRVIGDASYSLAGADVEVLGWNAATEVADLAGIDIGVMPLPDDEWARGKCGLKALQYMALGIPTVLSPVGVNCRIARDGAAVLATNASEWITALSALIDDAALRAQIGDAGRVRVERDYSVAATLPKWHAALRAAAEGPER